MGMLERIGLVRKSNLDGLIQEAIDARRDLMLSAMEEPLFQEKGHDRISADRRMSSGTLRLYSSYKAKVNALKTSLTEKQRVNRVNVGNLRSFRSPFNYTRIDDFFRKESYFSRSVIRQIETMLRNGYDYVGDDAKIIQKARTQVNRLVTDSGITLDQMFYRWIKDILCYGIVILEKVRERQRDPDSKKDVRTNRIVKLRPIRPQNAVAYVDYTTDRLVSILEMGGTGSTIRNFWSSRSLTSPTKQIPGISVNDLAIGMVYDAIDFFPDPPCFQMLDDILTLRSIEETVELMAFQFGSPLLHTKVGTETEPATPQEVDTVNNRIIDMAPNGMITTDHRVDIDVVNLQKGIADLMPYIEHFKRRVLVGSGSSSVSVGEAETANRDTAESIDDALADHCAFLGKIASNIMTYNVILDLLRSEGVEEKDLFDKNGEPKVQMVFKEVSLNKQAARENMIINRWNSHLVGFTEARKQLGESPLSAAEQKELRVNMVDIPLKKAGPPPQGQGGSGGSAAAVRVQQQPRNQHGVKAGPGSTKN